MDVSRGFIIHQNVLILTHILKPLIDEMKRMNCDKAISGVETL